MAAWGFGEGLWTSQGEQDRREFLLLLANQYLPRPITSLVDFEQQIGMTGTAVTVKTRASRNIVRVLVDTAMSRYAKTETRVQYMTNAGTPGQQDVSEERTDAANALLEQTKSERELRKMALHGTLFDLGACKIIDDGKGPAVEHTAAWELMYDPADAKRGNPTILVQRFAADRDALADEFAPELGPKADDQDEKTYQERSLDRKTLRDQILDSGLPGMVTSDHTPSDQHCVVYEMWRLPVGGNKGRHVVVTDKALCLDEEWEAETFPFVFFGYSENPVGPYPVSVAAIVSDLQLEINGLAERRMQILRLMAVPIWVEHGAPSADGTSACTTVQLRGGSGAIGDIVQAPVGTTLERIPAGNLLGTELAGEEDRAWTRGFQMTGMNEQSAIGSRPAGLNSAPSQREWNELQQDRLSLTAINYQQAHVDLCDRLLERVAKLPDYEINVKTTNGKFLKKLRAADLDLENSDYVIIRYPIGALPSTPTGKLAAAADLLQAQAIDKDEFKQIVQLPDLKAELNVDLASRGATQKFVGDILAGLDAHSPLEKMDLGYAVKYGTAILLLGYANKLDQFPNGVPEDRLSQLNDWIDAAAAMLAKKTPPAPAPAAPAAPTSIGPLTPAPLAPAGVQGMAA